jgi:hypothetical protein
MLERRRRRRREERAGRAARGTLEEATVFLVNK